MDGYPVDILSRSTNSELLTLLLVALEKRGLLAVGGITAPDIPGLRRIGIDQSQGAYPCFQGKDGHAQRRYGSGFLYLLRPDGHVCAVFDQPDSAAIARAFARAFDGALDYAKGATA